MKNFGSPMERLSLFNTLSKEKEEFVPKTPGKVKMYICGPTVYDSPHIGHARTYISFDIIKRVLTDYFKYDVTLVMNITNIDDKIIKRAGERGMSCDELSDKYENEFFAEMDRLGVQRPDFVTRVTEYVPECIRFVERLETEGLTYVSNGSVYFDLKEYRARFQYNLLRPQTFQDEDAEGLGEKRSREDFVLWKASKAGEPVYETKWGPGRPGWHIECSAMSTAMFGSDLDIHAGGIDLAFPHHENEIAQCQGHSGKHWVRYFLHTGHLNIDGLKMSKSLKNFLTIGEILSENSASTLRILFLQHSWNRDMSYDKKQLEHAEAIRRRIFNFVSNAESLVKRNDRRSLNQVDRKALEDLGACKDSVHRHLSDNINTAKALDQVTDLISATNVNIKSLHTDVLSAIYRFVVRILGLFGVERETETHNSEEGIAAVLNTYRSNIRKALKSKSPPSVFFGLSDDLRKDVKQFGFAIDDNQDESIIRRL